MLKIISKDDIPVSECHQDGRLFSAEEAKEAFLRGLKTVALNTSIINALDLFIDGPMSWLPPNHPSLSVFDPSSFEHHRLKYDQPTVVIRGLTPNLSDHQDQFGQIISITNNRGSGVTCEVLDTSLPDPDANDDCAHIDTLSLVMKLENYRAVSDSVITDSDLMALISSDWSNMAGIKIDSEDRGSRNFYKHSHKLTYSGVSETGIINANLGFIAYGGNADTCQIHITGFGCEYLSSVPGCYEKIRNWCEHIRVKISRVDLAYDDLEAELFQVRTANIDAENGMYSNANGGRKVTCSNMCGDWANDDREGKGLSIYFGQRQSARLYRIYEKGKQLGDPNSKWVRAELELHARNFHIPYDVLIEPGKYLAGSCPAMGRISDEQISIKAIRKHKVMATIEQMISVCKHQYGRLINALHEIGYSSERIINELKRDGIPSRLEFPMSEKQPYERSYSYDYEGPDPFGMVPCMVDMVAR